MRQDERAPFVQALQRARVSAYAPGEFVEQESFMLAAEIRALAVQAGIAPGVSVLDLCCGVAGPGRFITRELGCTYLGVDLSAGAIEIARERAGDLPCRFEVASIPPIPAGLFDVVLLLETMVAFPDKEALLQGVSGVLATGGRFAFTLEEGEPLTEAERERMPDADTVWLTPLPEMLACLERAGLVVRRQDDRSRSHLCGGGFADRRVRGRRDGHRGADRESGPGRVAGGAPALERLAARGTGPQIRVRRREDGDALKLRRSRSARRALVNGLHLQRETVHCDDPDEGATRKLRARARLPELAPDADLARGVEWVRHLARGSDERADARLDLLAPHAALPVGDLEDAEREADEPADHVPWRGQDDEEDEGDQEEHEASDDSPRNVTANHPARVGAATPGASLTRLG